MILRIHDSNNAQNTNGDGWLPSPILTKKLVETIIDPHNANAARDISSIPSPFGRMDLVRTAFRELVVSKEVEGVTLHHKLVSDALDVAQIIFHLERFEKAGLVKLLRWERRQELAELLASNRKGHRELGKALNKYLQQDKENFNFSKLDSLALLVFVHPETKAETVLGGTSSVSLFFAAPGRLDESGAGKYIKFGKDMPFDGDYCPLHKREDAFVVWLYALAKSYADMSIEFKEVYDYLELIRVNHLSVALQGEVNTLTAQSYVQNYTPLHYSAGNPLEIFPGFTLCGNNANIGQVVWKKSQFLLKTYSKPLGANIPLVLPIEKGYAHLHYVTDKWDPTTEVLKNDERPLNQRTLPGDGNQYPYLTLGDFLGDKLIRLRNTLNEEDYYAGRGQSDVVRRQSDNSELTTGGYLLPLKPLFFDYFTPEELIRHDMVSLRRFGTSVEVTIRIPIEGGEMVYQQKYEEPMEGSFTQVSNIPQIHPLALEFGLVRNREHSHLACILPNDTRGFNLMAHILDPSTGQLRREQLAYTLQATASGDNIYTSEVMGQLSLVELELDGLTAVIVPRKTFDQRASRKVSYAVDLGTTNSSISYVVDGNMPQLLSWSGAVLASLTQFNRFTSGQDILSSRLFLPECGGDGKLYAFPMRTALRVDKERIAHQTPGQGSSPNLTYQVAESEPEYSSIVTNIKWNPNDTSKNLDAYIEGLCVLLRQHAETLDAEVERLVWLYPSSMTGIARRRLEDIWVAASRKYLGAGCTVQRCNEAVAPYYHLAKTIGMLGSAVSMDIGGETVDVLFTGVNQNATKHLTSYRLGGNTLFGSAENSQSVGSAFARLLYGYLEKHRQSDGRLPRALRAMQEHIQNGKSEEAVSLYFALAKREKPFVGMELDLDKLLDTQEFGASHLRALPLLYFALQVYYIAELVFISKLERPRFFVFSGTGSRILKLIGDEQLLSRLVSFIFGQVDSLHGVVETSEAIQIRFSVEPKVATAHGAVTMPLGGADEPKSMLLVAGGEFRSDDVNASQTIDANYDFDGLKQSTLADLKDFASVFKELSVHLRLEREYGYTRESLDFITRELVASDNAATFDAFVKTRLQGQEEISEGAIFTLMNERIKMIGVKLANDVCKI